jgi:sterol desaturase/sphingolipid hydroxylase (fatty acid hydroxylase superfamily)
MVESVLKPGTHAVPPPTRVAAEPTSPTSASSSSSGNSPREADDIAKALEQRRKNASQLAGGYTKQKQMMETISIFAFAAVYIVCVYRLATTTPAVEGAPTTSMQSLVTKCGFAIIGALLAADFVGGFAHWAFDTWGSLECPVVGPTFIRSFREHHVNPSALAHHDWREANGDNCLVVLLALLPMSLCRVTTGPSVWSSGVLNVVPYMFLLWFTLFVTITNQIHKWAHMRPKDVPAWVKRLQESNVILSKRAHNLHHSTFDAHYCITTGWMNYPLEMVDFWRRLENLIQAVTGVPPRADDMKWSAGFGTTEGVVKVIGPQ